MRKTDKSRIQSDPKDKQNVDQDQDYKVKYEKKRKQAVRKFGESNGNA